MDEDPQQPRAPDATDRRPARRTRRSPCSGCPPARSLAIFVGGAVGTVCRYLLDGPPPDRDRATSPGSTLAGQPVGLAWPSGCWCRSPNSVAHRLPLARPLLIVGFLGGWTTYSTLAVEATLLAKDGDVADLPRLPGRDRARRADARRRRPRARPADGAARELLPHARPGAARRAGRRRRCRPARAAHPPRRRARRRPAPPRHDASSTRRAPCSSGS